MVVKVKILVRELRVYVCTWGPYRYVNSQGLQDAAAMKRRSSDLGDHLLVRLRAFDQRW